MTFFIPCRNVSVDIISKRAFCEASSFTKLATYSGNHGDARSRRKKAINTRAPKQEPVTKRIESGTLSAKSGGGTVIQAKIKTIAVKNRRFQVVAVSGIPCDEAVLKDMTIFPRIANREAAQAILYSCLHAINPMGTRKKKESKPLLSNKRLTAAPIRAGI